MSRPIQSRVLLNTGIVLALYPFTQEQGIEIQRAPDSSGDPDVANAEIIAFVNAGVDHYTDVQPVNGARLHYRTRHRQGNAVSDWTSWVSALPIEIPDPLPPVPSLPPLIEARTGFFATNIVFKVDAMMGEVNFGTIEFEDPVRSFAAAGSITAADKTLTISGGDLATEDVNLYCKVAGAGVAGTDLITRIDSVTSATECELEDAASTTVGTPDVNVDVGGGFFTDFDYDGTDESKETNTRNRPINGAEPTWINFRNKIGNTYSAEQRVEIPAQI